MVEEEGMTLMGAAAKSGVPYATRPNCETWLASQTGLGQMRVKHFTGEPKNRQRHAEGEVYQQPHETFTFSFAISPLRFDLISVNADHAERDAVVKAAKRDFFPGATV